MAELMLAMEPIFGDYKPQFTEITNNFINCICTAGLPRDQLTDYLSDLFNKRKQILYDENWENSPLSLDYANQLEIWLREAIIKLLDIALKTDHHLE